MPATPADAEFKKWFDDYLAEWRGFVESNLADGVDPVIMIVKKMQPGETKPTIAVSLCPMETPAQRSAVFKVQQVVARELELVEAVVVTSEAWSVELDLKDLPEDQREAKLAEARKQGSLADHPGRTEIVIWNAMRGTQQLLAHADIVIGEDGTKRLGKTDIVDPTTDGKHTGRMVLSDVTSGS